MTFAVTASLIQARSLGSQSSPQDDRSNCETPMLTTIVEALAAYARLAHTLRLSRIGPGSFWFDLPLTLSS